MCSIFMWGNEQATSPDPALDYGKQMLLLSQWAISDHCSFRRLLSRHLGSNNKGFLVLVLFEVIQ